MAEQEILPWLSTCSPVPKPCSVSLTEGPVSMASIIILVVQHAAWEVATSGGHILVLTVSLYILLETLNVLPSP